MMSKSPKLPGILRAFVDTAGSEFMGYPRRRADQIHAETVAVGPWWRGGGQDEIDAVVLAGRARTLVMVGEAKRARKVDARRLLPKPARKATEGVEAGREVVRGGSGGARSGDRVDAFGGRPVVASPRACGNRAAGGRRRRPSPFSAPVRERLRVPTDLAGRCGPSMRGSAAVGATGSRRDPRPPRP